MLPAIFFKGDRELVDKIVSYIFHPEKWEYFIYVKISFIAVSIIFFVGIIVLLIKSSWLKRRLLEDITEFSAYRPYGAKKIFKQWMAITKKLESKKESEYKLAVIEADSLLEGILKKMGYKGETLSEILEQVDASVLPNINEVKEAHKIRNNLAYDPDYHLTQELAEKTLSAYENAFRSLELF